MWYFMPDKSCLAQSANRTKLYPYGANIPLHKTLKGIIADVFPHLTD